MVALPIVLLLMGSALALVPARRAQRFRKVIAVGAAWAAWIASLGLARQVPASVSLSIWRPEELFGDRIGLSLDVAGWTVGFGLLTALVAALVQDPRPENQSGIPFAGLLGFGAIGLAAIQAGNLLTTTLTWALLDLLGLVLLARAAGVGEVPDPRWWGRLLTSATGILVAMSAVIGLGAGAAGSDLEALAAHPLATAIFTIGVVIRLAGTTLPVVEVAGEENGQAARSLVVLVPTAACAAALARVGLAAEGAMAWLTLPLGVAALLFGCIRWAPRSHADVERALPILGIGLVGVGALGSAADPGVARVTWSATGSLILLVGTSCAMSGSTSWLGRASALVAALVIAGLPFSLGARLVSPFLGGMTDVGRLVTGGLAGLGLAALGSGIWELAREGMPRPQKPSAGGIAGWAAWLFVVTAVFAGYAFLASQAGDVVQTGSLATLALLVVGVWLRRRWIPGGFLRLSRVARWLDPRLAVREAARTAELILKAARGVADLVEGEAAMLWIYVIMVALGAAAAASR